MNNRNLSTAEILILQPCYTLHAITIPLSPKQYFYFIVQGIPWEMDEWSGKSSSKQLHEAIKQSINGLVYNSSQGKENIQ